MAPKVTDPPELPELPFALDKIAFAFASQTANDGWRVAVVGQIFSDRAGQLSIVQGSLSEVHAKHIAARIRCAATAARALLR